MIGKKKQETNITVKHTNEKNKERWKSFQREIHNVPTLFIPFNKYNLLLLWISGCIEVVPCTIHSYFFLLGWYCGVFFLSTFCKYLYVQLVTISLRTINQNFGFVMVIVLKPMAILYCSVSGRSIHSIAKYSNGYFIFNYFYILCLYFDVLYICDLK